MAGVDVGERWQMLADKVERQCTGRVLAFIDAHYLLALAAIRGTDASGAMLEALRAHAASGAGTSARVSAAVGIALGEAIVAFRSQRYDACVDALAPVRRELHRLGGSHAQRDLFSQMLIEAALRAQRSAYARALLAERLALRPDNLWALRARQRAR
jgi:hypothetical protein